LIYPQVHSTVLSKLIGKGGKIKRKLYEKYQFSFNISPQQKLFVRKKGKLEKRFSEFLFWVELGFGPMESAYGIYRNKILSSISFEQYVKGNIRRKRYKIGSLIGRNGIIKKRIEGLSNSKILISKKGCYIIGSEKNCDMAKILIRRRLANFTLTPSYDKENNFLI